MKKLLTLLLVLLLSVGLAVPALAFTSDTSEEEDHPYDLKIYLVEYEDNDLFGFATLPPSDRGYAKNEIVAAVVELAVPEDEVITSGDYETLVFGGDNVDLDVTDNYVAGAIDLLASSNVDDDGSVSIANTLNSDDEIEMTITSLPGENTYKWLFFAKVTDDDASLYAKLIDGTDFHTEATFTFDDEDEEGSHLYITLDGIEYDILNTDTGSGDFQYIIHVCDGGDYEEANIYIDVDEDNVSLGMSIEPGSGEFAGDEFALGVNTKNELGVVDLLNPAKILTSGDEFDAVMDIYEDVVVDVFGMDYFLIGNYVRDSFFEDLVSGDTIVATVDIAPWTAYVTVPDEIVVDPPKTGDAASILGFVMVALAGSGALLLKKRG